MDFSFSDDQQMLRDSVIRYLEREYDHHQRAAVLDQGGFSSRHWANFADFGWLAAPFSEADGGLGGGPIETLVIMEEFGRRAVIEPFVWTVVVGGQLLLADRDGRRRADRLGALITGKMQIALAAIEDDRGFDFTRIEGKATRDGTGFRLAGRKPVVPNGGIADQFVVAMRTAGAAGDTDGLTLFLVSRDAPGVDIRTYRLHDGGTGAELTLDNVILGADSVLGEIDGGLTELDRACDHGIAALCAEAVGSAAYLVQATADYLKIRVQYGQPLARFQVVQHRLADMYMAAETCRSMSYVAALALTGPAAGRTRDCAAAKAHINRHAGYVARQAVQLHGGMGMSEELDVAHHFKRLTMIGRMLGDEAHHLKRFAALADAA